MGLFLVNDIHSSTLFSLFGSCSGLWLSLNSLRGEGDGKQLHYGFCSPLGTKSVGGDSPSPPLGEGDCGSMSDPFVLASGHGISVGTGVDGLILPCSDSDRSKNLVVVTVGSGSY